MHRKTPFLLIVLILSAVACNLSGSPAPQEEILEPPPQDIAFSFEEGTAEATEEAEEDSDDANGQNTTTSSTTSGSHTSSSTVGGTSGSTSSSTTGGTSSGSIPPANAYVPLGYVVNLTAPYPACSVTPSGAYSVNIRQSPATNSSIVGTLLHAAWVRVSRISGGWFQLDYPGTPVHNTWVSGSVVTLNQPCTCGPNCSPNIYNPPPPPNNICTMFFHTATWVYSGSSPNYPIIGQIAQNTRLAVLARSSTTTFFQVPFGNTWGWVNAPIGVTLEGNCANLPVEGPPNPPPVTPIAACSIQNQLAMGIFSGPGTTFINLGQVGPLEMFTGIARSENGWYKTSRTINGSEVWLDSNGGNLAFTTGCNILPFENVPAPLPFPEETFTCLAIASDGGLIRVYTSPSLDADSVSVEGPLAVIGQNSAATLYAVPIGDGGFYNWIEIAAVTVSGECGSIPVFTN